MIFISYNHKDSEIVQVIATKMAIVFGKENVFFDAWSIQPGDGIIDKMNEGLENATHFFFIMSKTSIQSNMVKLEWQNALYIKSKRTLRFIPVKLDDCFVPPILMQNVFIDVFGKGIEVGLRQMIDVVKGQQSILDGSAGYQNVRGEFSQSDEGKDITINIYAKTYFEPNARFLILHGNNNERMKLSLKSDSMFNSGKHENVRLSDASVHNALFVGVSRGISPGFPLRAEIKSEDSIDFHGVMRATSENEWLVIPIEKK
ncbi:MAG: toll/interleukin-1 receptor domain-containing protein [Tenericutes bacterium HGW-Tenericutes-5]|jgi:hypothetical protein|nr:MAG: toll/interleukin-1 receptor domain-containing protein [Tenericutes bacterium HGW-Tenericutes-5]